VNLDKTQQLVLDLASSTLFSYPAKLASDTDWNRLYMEAVQQSDNVVASNMRINYEHTELDSMMKTAGIPYVILKGAASANYYPEPNLRTMGDVDFLVYKADFNRVCLLMESAGFNRLEETDAHIAYKRSTGGVWEAHWQMSGIPQGGAGCIVHNALDNMIETGCESENGVLPDDLHHGWIYKQFHLYEI
jgi:hypothetical protein